MDPVAAGEVSQMMANPPWIAALIALAIALVKVLEVAIHALVKKYGKGEKAQQVEITFDKEITDKIGAMALQVNDMHNVMGRTDNDGTPMVYSSRSGMEAVRDIAVIIRNVSQTQERLARVMERLEAKLVEHDRADNKVQSSINDALERLIKSFDDHDRRMAESIKDLKKE